TIAHVVNTAPRFISFSCWSRMESAKKAPPHSWPSRPRPTGGLHPCQRGSASVRVLLNRAAVFATPGIGVLIRTRRDSNEWAERVYLRNTWSVQKQETEKQ